MRTLALQPCPIESSNNVADSTNCSLGVNDSLTRDCRVNSISSALHQAQLISCSQESPSATRITCLHTCRTH